MSHVTAVLTVSGALLGVVAFFWQIWSALRSWLILGMEIRNPGSGDVIVRVTVSNSGLSSKMISFAGLILSPQEVTLREAAARLASQSLSQGNGPTHPLVSLFRSGRGRLIHSGNCVLIPLRDLYEDQSMVGPGEVLSYALSLNRSTLPDAAVVVIRFIVFISYMGIYIRWRYTSDALAVPRSQPEEAKVRP
jgi:hypothetical protein